MKTTQQNSDFLHIGEKILLWYSQNARNLPWRETQNPYHIWISEIILQQTRVEQGLDYYLKFIERFSDVQTLANADIDEVLLYWKGLGYYSRAINLHKAAQQIVIDYKGIFPSSYNEILKLKGIGKYTAAAISSICFNEKIPAVDGNFYRVLSRIFADDFDISKTQAHQYFSGLTLLIMPNRDFGDFNQAVMDLGANICKPKNPDCQNCPIQQDCLAFNFGKATEFPIKTKKIKAENLDIQYYFVHYQGQFLLKQRGDGSIWKKLYDFPETIPAHFTPYIIKEEKILHKLTHKNLTITISSVYLENSTDFEQIKNEQNLISLKLEDFQQKSFPKPLESFLEKLVINN